MTSARSGLADLVEDRLSVHGRLLGRRAGREFLASLPKLAMLGLPVGSCLGGVALWGLGVHSLMEGIESSALPLPLVLAGLLVVHAGLAYGLWRWCARRTAH